MTTDEINKLAREAGLPISWLDSGKASAWPELERFARAILSRAPVDAALPVTDGQLEAMFTNAGGRWDGDRWVIEDANLHPALRTVLDAAAPSGGVPADMVPQPAIPAGAPRLSSIQRDHDEIAEAFRTAPLYGAPAQSADMVLVPRAILEAVHRELDEDDGGNAPGHAHSVVGIWDDDNGAKAGKPCAWCLTWRHFTDLIAAAAGAPTKAPKDE